MIPSKVTQPLILRPVCVTPGRLSRPAPSLIPGCPFRLAGASHGLAGDGTVDLGRESPPRVHAALYPGSQAAALVPLVLPRLPNGPAPHEGTFLKPPPLRGPRSTGGVVSRSPDLAGTTGSPERWRLHGQAARGPSVRPGSSTGVRPLPRLGSSDVRPHEQSDGSGGVSNGPAGDPAARLWPPGALEERPGLLSRRAGPSSARPAPRRAGHPAPRRRPGERPPREAGGMGEPQPPPHARSRLASPSAAPSSGNRGRRGGRLGP